MRPWLLGVSLVALCLVAILGWRSVSSAAASREVVELTPEKKAALAHLRAERKFQPNDFPPLGYTGMATPGDEAVAVGAVDGVIDAIASRPRGPLAAKDVSQAIGAGMRKVRDLETEDRDRTQGYMLEVWYLLGFKGSTGLFSYGGAYKAPPGYLEPLPPGWNSPTQPRPVGGSGPPKG